MSSNTTNASSSSSSSLSPNRARRGMMGWIIGALAILLLVGVFLVPSYYGFMAGPNGYYPRPYFFPFGFLVFFFVIFFVARGLFWGWGWGWGWRGGYSRGYWRHGGYNEAEEILRQRYAKGEITKDQFDQMMRDLQAHDA